jgi:hypothetical protein
MDAEEPRAVAASEAARPLPPADGGVDDFTPRYLEPEKVRLFRSPAGSARLELAGEVCYPRVVVRRLQPLTEPERYIALWAGEDAEIGILRDTQDLDDESRAILHEELAKRYFAPAIHRIIRVQERFGVHEWEVVTSHGRITFSVRGLHQNVKQVPPARLFVTDVQGNRYDIPDVNALDPRSYRQIQRHV